MENLPVIFRKATDDSILAVFPTIAETGAAMLCYAHIGQHGSCSNEYYATTKPATPAESAPLLAELRGIYEFGEDAVKLIPVKRRTPAINAQWLSAWRDMVRL